MASLAYQLADRLVDGGLAAFIDSQRATGASYDRIARELSDLTDTFISGETVRRWADEDAA